MGVGEGKNHQNTMWCKRPIFKKKKILKFKKEIFEKRKIFACVRM